MKKLFLSSIICIFTILTFLNICSAGERITVDDDGGANWETIQEAVDHANSQDIILVYPGTYKENISLVMRPSMKIISLEGRTETKIEGNFFFGHEGIDQSLIGFTVTDKVSISCPLYMSLGVIIHCEIGTLERCGEADQAKIFNSIIHNIVNQEYILSDPYFVNNIIYSPLNIISGGNYVVNNILIGNGEDSGIYWQNRYTEDFSPPLVDYNLVYGFSNPHDENIIFGKNVIETDPKIVGADFELYQGNKWIFRIDKSPAIAKGHPEYKNPDMTRADFGIHGGPYRYYEDVLKEFLGNEINDIKIREVVFMHEGKYNRGSREPSDELDKEVDVYYRTEKIGTYQCDFGQIKVTLENNSDENRELTYELKIWNGRGYSEKHDEEIFYDVVYSDGTNKPFKINTVYRTAMELRDIRFIEANNFNNLKKATISFIVEYDGSYDEFFESGTLSGYSASLIVRDFQTNKILDRYVFPGSKDNTSFFVVQSDNEKELILSGVGSLSAMLLGIEGCYVSTSAAYILEPHEYCPDRNYNNDCSNLNDIHAYYNWLGTEEKRAEYQIYVFGQGGVNLINSMLSTSGGSSVVDVLYSHYENKKTFMEGYNDCLIDKVGGLSIYDWTWAKIHSPADFIVTRVSDGMEIITDLSENESSNLTKGFILRGDTNHEKMLLLRDPHEEYLLQIRGTNEAVHQPFFSFSLSHSKPSGCITYLEYEDVPTNRGSLAQLNFGPNTADYSLGIDNDADGNIDSFFAPTTTITKDSDDDGLGCDSEDNCFSVYNPNQFDTDVDGVGDVCDNCMHDINPHQEDADDDGIGDMCDDDDDNDGLYDLEEFSYNTNPFSQDTDQDGINDFKEINKYKTDPVSSDSDNDGLIDGVEVENNSDPNTMDFFVAKEGSDLSGNGSLDAPWLTIQHAINSITNSPAFIRVDSGVYDENIILMPNISLICLDHYSCIINGSSSFNIVTMASNTVLSGFTLSYAFETAIYNNSSNVSIKDNIIEDSGLGAIWYFKGGGIYFGNNSSGLIEKNLIRRNYASDGGGVYLEGHDIRFKNNIVENNRAADPSFGDGGGGVYLKDCHNTIVKDNLIQNNGTEFGLGGGIYTHGCDSTTIIKNNTILENAIGGIVSYDGSSIVNNTISENSGVGIGAWGTSGKEIINNIISNNSGAGIFTNTGMIPVLYCNVWGNSPNYLGMDDKTGIDGNISEDPLYKDQTNSIFILTPLSPSINSGIPYDENHVHGDYKDEPLPHGFRINQGALGGTYAAISKLNQCLGDIDNDDDVDGNDLIEIIANPSMIALPLFTGTFGHTSCPL